MGASLGEDRLEVILDRVLGQRHLARHRSRVAARGKQADQFVFALEIVETFGWDYHRASVLIVLAGCRRRRLGELDTQAHAALDQAARICAAHSLSSLLATIDEMRQVRRG